MSWIFSQISCEKSTANSFLSIDLDFKNIKQISNSFKDWTQK